MAERETEYLFKPYQMHIYIPHKWGAYPQKVKIKDRISTYEVCRVMVDGKLVHERHSDYSIEATEKNNKKDGKHTGRCNLCGSIQTEPHSWENKPQYIKRDDINHKYLCSKFDTKGHRCEGYYLEKHSKQYSFLFDPKGKNYRSPVWHMVFCEICGGSWQESHCWKEDGQGETKWEISNKDKHHKTCIYCGQEEEGNHSNIKYFQKFINNGDFDTDKHTAVCGVCHGPWLEDHDWLRKSDNSLRWESEKTDSQYKTHHRVQCRKCKGFLYERHNYDLIHVKSGYDFETKCICGKTDSINKWSIAYKNVPCGNKKTMNIQLKYTGKGYLYLKILPDDQGNYPNYPIVYTGDSKRPSPENKNEKLPIHVKNGWYKRGNGEDWNLSSYKKYTYKKHFVIEGVKESENRGILYEGERYKGYRLISDYAGYESSGSGSKVTNIMFSLKDINANKHRYSTSKTKVTNEKEGGADTIYYFYRGRFNDFWIYSNKLHEEPYILFPCVRGWHKSKKSLISGSYIVTG